jgi:uncharacterized membrane protein YkvA (DUF1232 family)
VSEPQDFSQHFSRDNFWKKLQAFARKAGREVVEKALLLYYALENPSVPDWARKAIYGAIGYFILPLDALPDFTPFVGFADDLGVLTVALAAVAFYVNDEVKKRAAEKLAEWFDNEDRKPDAAPSEVPKDEPLRLEE